MINKILLLVSCIVIPVGVIGGAVIVLGSMVDDWHVILFLSIGLLAVAALIQGAATAAGGARGVVDWWTERSIKLDLHRVALAKQQLDLALVPATGAVPRALVESGALTQRAFALEMRRLENGRPVQPVPTTLHYAPHYARIVEDKAAATPALALVEPEARPVDDFWELYSNGDLPSNEFLMGYNMADGEPVNATWKQLYSALIGGVSGSGKSTLVRFILTQSALQGGRFVVIDPHFAAGEESLGASLQPLRSRLMGDIAANDKQMLDALKYVRLVGQQRLAGKDKSKSPLILVVDETTALLQRSDVAEELLKVLGQIAQETRKVGVYAMCIGQNFHSDVMKTTVRNSFVSMFSCRTRSDVARVMSGSGAFAKSVETLKVGQAVWMAPSGDLIRLNVPNTTHAHIEAVAREIDGECEALEVEPMLAPRVAPMIAAENRADAAPETVAESAEPSAGEAVDATLILDKRRMGMVHALIKAGLSRNEILKEVWGVDRKQGGNKLAKAAKELDEVIHYLLT